MATKKAGSRLETEIERCRSECQWERIPELVKQLSAKLIANDDMAELLLGESKLEQFLKENALKQSSSPRGPRPKLTEVRKHLTAALDRGNLKPEFLQEANLIMAKLNYVEGDYKEALNTYARVGVDDLQLSAVPPYRLRMIAEAYSTKEMMEKEKEEENRSTKEEVKEVKWERITSVLLQKGNRNRQVDTTIDLRRLSQGYTVHSLQPLPSSPCVTLSLLYSE